MKTFRIFSAFIFMILFMGYTRQIAGVLTAKTFRELTIRLKLRKSMMRNSTGSINEISEYMKLQ